jgi:hypothetical protein
MHEAHQIAFELDGTVPALEGKEGAPFKPEVRFEKAFGEPIRDALAGEQFSGVARSTTRSSRSRSRKPSA